MAGIPLILSLPKKLQIKKVWRNSQTQKNENQKKKKCEEIENEFQFHTQGIWRSLYPSGLGSFETEGGVLLVSFSA